MLGHCVHPPSCLAVAGEAQHRGGGGLDKVLRRRILQVHDAEGGNLPQLAADDLLVGMPVQCPEEVGLVVPILLVGSVELQMLLGYVHPQGTVKLHVAQTVGAGGKSVG